MTLQEWLGSRLGPVEAGLKTRWSDAWPSPFGPMLQYPIQTGGKRVRPALVLAAHEAVAADPTDLGLATAAALAVELIHTYSLVHDDLPAMDNDDERRGKPTVHVAFGEPAAILVGDALLTEAFAVLAQAPGPAERRIRMVGVLAQAAGHSGMIGGQAADVGLGGDIVDLSTLEQLHARKTGALITASTALGGLAGAAGLEQQLALQAYGEAVGLAFQLADDVLDADQDQRDGDGPPSYVKLLGIDETRRRAIALSERAIAAVAPLRRPHALQQLARFVVERDL